MKLQLLAFAQCPTEASDRGATSSSVTTDDGETPSSKKPKSGTVASLFAGMSWPNRKRLTGIQAIESEISR